MENRAEVAQQSTNDAAGNPQEFFREPPHLNTDASRPLAGPLSSSELQIPVSDSGYSSLQSCSCSCHDHPNPSNLIRGEKPFNCLLDVQLMG